MDNAEVETKQEFLRDQILEEGFDGAQFFEFLKSELLINDDELDLEVIDMKTLESIVTKFKQLSLEPSDNEDESDSKCDSPAQKRASKILNNLEVIDCIKIPENIFTKDKPMVELTDPVKTDGGFFGSSYVTYLITTQPYGLSVRRRYSEIWWLRTKLVLLFPGIVVNL